MPKGTASATSSAPPTTRFRFVGGSTALDFINTVNWAPGGLERDLFASFGALVEWGELAGVLSAAAGERLRDLARVHPDGAREALARAHALRETLQRLFAAVAAGEPPAAGVLERFNAALADAQARLHIARVEDIPGAPTFEWRWRGMGEDLTCVFWSVLRAAAELLASPELARLHVCAGESCGWMYVDRSRNGLRRWCEMRTCGSVVKARRYYERTRGRGREQAG